MEFDSFIPLFIPQFKKEGVDRILDLGFGIGRHAIFSLKLPHHYFNMDESNQYLNGFIILVCEEKEQFHHGGFHWYILARLNIKK